MEFSTFIAAGVILWYVPVIVVTTIVHIFVNKWRIWKKASYIPLYGIGIMVCIGTLYLMLNVFRIRLSLSGYVNVIGFVLFSGGIIFLFWSYFTLSWHKLSWLCELESSSSQSAELVTVGPYSLCRHPVYSAAIVIIVSAFLISGVILLIVPLLAIFPLLVIEEHELRRRFGDTYIIYSKVTPLLLGLRVASGQTK